jgi:hypothetical protein
MAGGQGAFCADGGHSPGAGPPGGEMALLPSLPAWWPPPAGWQTRHAPLRGRKWAGRPLKLASAPLWPASAQSRAGWRPQSPGHGSRHTVAQWQSLGPGIKGILTGRRATGGPLRTGREDLCSQLIGPWDTRQLSAPPKQKYFWKGLTFSQGREFCDQAV